MNRIAKSLVAVSVCLLTAAPAFSAPASGKATPTPTPFPKSGTLSGSYTGGPGKTAVDGNWGNRSEIDSNAPITGSVSRVAVGNGWKMKIFNNSKDSYSADVSVVQLDNNGGKVKEDHYSYNLGPSKSAERSFSAQSNTTNCTLNLNSWKKTSVDKSEAAPSPTPAVAKPADLPSEAIVPKKHR